MPRIVSCSLDSLSLSTFAEEYKEDLYASGILKRPDSTDHSLFVTFFLEIGFKEIADRIISRRDTQDNLLFRLLNREFLKSEYFQNRFRFKINSRHSLDYLLKAKPIYVRYVALVDKGAIKWDPISLIENFANKVKNEKIIFEKYDYRAASGQDSFICVGIPFPFKDEPVREVFVNLKIVKTFWPWNSLVEFWFKKLPNLEYLKAAKNQEQTHGLNFNFSTGMHYYLLMHDPVWHKSNLNVPIKFRLEADDVLTEMVEKEGESELSEKFSKVKSITIRNAHHLACVMPQFLKAFSSLKRLSILTSSSDFITHFSMLEEDIFIKACRLLKSFMILKWPLPAQDMLTICQILFHTRQIRSTQDFNLLHPKFLKEAYISSLVRIFAQIREFSISPDTLWGLMNPDIKSVELDKYTLGKVLTCLPSHLGKLELISCENLSASLGLMSVEEKHKLLSPLKSLVLKDSPITTQQLFEILMLSKSLRELHIFNIGIDISSFIAKLHVQGQLESAFHFPFLEILHIQEMLPKAYVILEASLRRSHSLKSVNIIPFSSTGKNSKAFEFMSPVDENGSYAHGKSPVYDLPRLEETLDLSLEDLKIPGLEHEDSSSDTENWDGSEG